MARPKPKWTKKTLKLKKNHGWQSRPGYNIFVADRGAVRFDFPRSWIIEPGENGSIKFHDKKPPDDDCTLQITVMYLPDGVDWSGLKLGFLLRELTGKEELEILERGEVIEERRPDGLEIAWVETRFMDKEQQREAYSRTLLARWSNIQPLITFAFWVDDRPRLDPAWAELLRTLKLGDYVEDPTQRVLD